MWMLSILVSWTNQEEVQLLPSWKYTFSLSFHTSHYSRCCLSSLTSFYASEHLLYVNESILNPSLCSFENSPTPIVQILMTSKYLLSAQIWLPSHTYWLLDSFMYLNLRLWIYTMRLTCPTLNSLSSILVVCPLLAFIKWLLPSCLSKNPESHYWLSFSALSSHLITRICWFYLMDISGICPHLFNTSLVIY